ncbi:hypothetical protein ACFV27_38815 [Streptomyces antimycoticus]|uniref:hypothetical protein n=1 Tax=Streptomyces antimycoticus TaxID=68175 RepID=UPI0036B6D992
MKITRKHTVSYAGCDAGIAELGWAQGEMLSYVQTRGPGNLLYVTKFSSLEGGTVDVAGVLEAIRLTVESNDAFRTRYLVEQGQWRQEIQGSGELSVAEIAAPSPELDAAGVMAILGRFSPEPQEVPVRVAIVTFEGRPTHIYLAFHHASADNMGTEIACQQLRRRSLGLPVPAAWQPREIVAFEASPAGRELAEKADKYHRARIRELAEFDLVPADRSRTPLREYQLASPAVVVAAEQIAQRVQVSPVSVTLAAYCTVLSARLAVTRFPLAVASGNRFNPKTRMSIAKVAQASSFCVEVTSSFDDFCHQISDAMLLAYRYGVYDPALMAKAFQDVDKDISFPYLANFHLNTALESPDPELRSAHLEVRPPELRNLVKVGAFNVTNPGDGVRFCDLSLDIYKFSDQADMRLRTDLTFFSEACLRDILISTERLLVEIACGSDITNL